MIWTKTPTIGESDEFANVFLNSPGVLSEWLSMKGTPPRFGIQIAIDRVIHTRLHRIPTSLSANSATMTAMLRKYQARAGIEC